MMAFRRPAGSAALSFFARGRGTQQGITTPSFLSLSERGPGSALAATQPPSSGRFLSSRPRGPPRPRPNPKLRTHAVSLFDGDYRDADDDDDGNYDDLYDYKSLHDIEAVDPEEMERARQAAEIQSKEDAKKAKWIENAKPPVRVPKIDERGRSYGRGTRKEASARVWIEPGPGNVVVNRMDFVDYFTRESDREMILSPFVATDTCGLFDVRCHVHGGGLTGQAGAIRHGLARALEKYNPDYRPPMKKLGYLTRDPRMVERKKVGLKKARKAPQWVRR